MKNADLYVIRVDNDTESAYAIVRIDDKFLADIDTWWELCIELKDKAPFAECSFHISNDHIVGIYDEILAETCDILHDPAEIEEYSFHEMLDDGGMPRLPAGLDLSKFTPCTLATGNYIDMSTTYTSKDMDALFSYRLNTLETGRLESYYISLYDLKRSVASNEIHQV